MADLQKNKKKKNVYNELADLNITNFLRSVAISSYNAYNSFKLNLLFFIILTYNISYNMWELIKRVSCAAHYIIEIPIPINCSQATQRHNTI